MKKYYLECKLCGTTKFDFATWFSNEQSCPRCGGKRVEARYQNLGARLAKVFARGANRFKGMWQYYDVLPLDSKDHVITAGEGDVAIDRLLFLEDIAVQCFGLNCRVYAHRHDNNYATGSFKDLAGSLVASVLNENNISKYVVASTGNIGVAFSRYISKYGGTLYAFIPENSPKFKEAEISIFGQRVFRVLGDYTKTKQMAEEFSKQHNVAIAAGTFDPMRIEAKKTMAFEWFRLMKKFPDVYIQALSGGTGPLGVVKGCEELLSTNLIKSIPRLILVQSSRCAPMADSWQASKKDGFPNGWEQNYSVYKDPNTEISTLATGNPTAYPILARHVRNTNGEIIDFPEEYVCKVARIVASETSVRIGPAAAVAVGGFFTALRGNMIRANDTVLINIGEGIRRDPDFMLKLVNDNIKIKSLDNCSLFDRVKYKEELWSDMQEYFSN